MTKCCPLRIHLPRAPEALAPLPRHVMADQDARAQSSPASLYLQVHEAGDPFGAGIRDAARALGGESKDDAVKPEPMTNRALFLAALRTTLNGAREGLLAQHLSRTLVFGGYLALSPPVGFPRVCTSASVLLILQMLAMFRVEDQKTISYEEHPSRSLQILHRLSFAVPSGMAGIAIVTSVIAPESSEAMQSALDIFTTNAAARVVRAGIQSWSRSPLTAGLNLVHADGTGLTASEQRRVNATRDALYTASSLLILFGSRLLAEEWVDEVQTSVTDTRSAFEAAALLGIFAGLNDVCEGWTDTAARVICSCIWEDVMLQPGSQANPRIDAAHFLDEAASRLTTGPTIDMFMVAAMVAKEADDSSTSIGIATFLLVAWATMNGLLGGLRGRLISYVSTPVPIIDDGTRDPAGLLSLLAQGMQSAALRVWHATQLAQRRSPASEASDSAAI